MTMSQLIEKINQNQSIISPERRNNIMVKVLDKWQSENLVPKNEEPLLTEQQRLTLLEKVRRDTADKLLELANRKLLKPSKAEIEKIQDRL